MSSQKNLQKQIQRLISFYSYKWFKDGLEFKNPGWNEEVIEETLPTGSRLHVQNAQESAVYTCEIAGQAGRVLESCHVTVTEGQSNSNSSKCRNKKLTSSNEG